MSVASDDSTEPRRRPLSAISCRQPLAATAAGSGPRTGRPRASSGETRAAHASSTASHTGLGGEHTASGDGYRAEVGGNLHRPRLGRGERPQTAGRPPRASRTPRRPTSVGARAIVSKPVRSKSSWIVVPRRKPRDAEQSRRDPIRCGRGREGALHRLLRPASQRDRVHLIDVELRQRLVEGAHQSRPTAGPVTTRLAFPLHRRVEGDGPTARSPCGARTRASPGRPTRGPCRSPPTRSRAALCSRSG